MDFDLIAKGLGHIWQLTGKGVYPKKKGKEMTSQENGSDQKG